MDNLKMNSKDLVKENLNQIAKLFPNVITESIDEEGNLNRLVDYDLLKQELSYQVVDGEKERYQLTWPGKKEAVALANMPVNKTLRPDKKESLDWDNTQNVYIEGDNLEALKILQESYLNSVKCIYIDPPYNTGKDLIYKDNYKQEIENYLVESGQKDDNGNRLVQNNESRGRFHSDWLSMMYPRLKLAKNLLSEDGVIFISIDDNESHNLRKICNEIFGEENYVDTFYIQVRYSSKSLTEKDDFQKLIEQVVIYKKPNFSPNKPYENYSIEKFKYKIFEKGKGRRENIGGRKVTIFKPEEYEIIKQEPSIDGLKETWASGTVLTGNASGKYFDKFLSPRVDIDGLGVLYKVEGIGRDGLGFRYFTGPKRAGATKGKFYSGLPLERRQELKKGEAKKYKPINNFYDFSSDFGNIRHEGGVDFRAGKKPVKFLKMLIEMATKENSIVLDFFAGSSSTAHAVMQLNSEDLVQRRFIMVQLPEKVDEKSDYYRAGFKTISGLGKERIRRAAKKIKEETNAEIDYGFRAFKVDTSNMKDVYYRPDEMTQKQIRGMVSNIKEDRSAEDLLIQVMLEWDLELSLSMEKKEILGKEVHFVAGNSLVACFEKGVSEKLVREIAEEEPLRVVFRDNSFENDSERINVEEIFKMLSPHTEIKVI